MCGISGIVKKKASERDLDIMLAAISHRGPDEFGTYVDDDAAIGTARLSIVDLSHGQQPIRDEATGVTIAFNGEIFNYIELREELIAKGHRFLTNSDTEVALRMYLEHSDSFAENLNGQFAIAIWEPGKKKLVLARDRFGIAPLFYHQGREEFIFSSEIKSLLTNPNIEKRINPRALDQIFTFWTTIGAHTALENIHELPPGNILVKTPEGTRISPYWTWQFPEQATTTSLSFADAQEALVEELCRSIEIRFRADVEVGAYLSGGLDSSVIVALACGPLKHKLRTFSVEFAEKSYDESKYQQIVSKLYETKHKAVLFREEDVDGRFEDVIRHTENPLFRTAPAPLSMLSEKVREDGLKVILTGEGSDELLLGYDIFRETKIRRFAGRFPSSQVRPQLFKRLYAYLPQFANPRYANIAIESLKRTMTSTSPFYSHEVRWQNNAVNKIYFSEALRAQLGSYNATEEFSSIVPPTFFEAGDVSRAQYLEMSTLLRGYLLSSQGDRMSMKNSIEARFPFLDHKLMHFIQGLPQRYKLMGLKDKWILRESMKPHLPEEIRRRPKFAYQAPELRAFFRHNGSISPLVDKYLSKEAISEAGLFSQELITNLLNKAKDSDLTRLGSRDNMAFLQVLSTQIFCSQFIKSDGRADAIKKLQGREFKTRIRVR